MEIQDIPILNGLLAFACIGFLASLIALFFVLKRYPVRSRVMKLSYVVILSTWAVANIANIILFAEYTQNWITRYICRGIFIIITFQASLLQLLVLKPFSFWSSWISARFISFLYGLTLFLFLSAIVPFAFIELYADIFNRPVWYVNLTNITQGLWGLYFITLDTSVSCYASYLLIRHLRDVRRNKQKRGSVVFPEVEEKVVVSFMLKYLTIQAICDWIGFLLVVWGTLGKFSLISINYILIQIGGSCMTPRLFALYLLHSQMITLKFNSTPSDGTGRPNRYITTKTNESNQSKKSDMKDTIIMNGLE